MGHKYEKKQIFLAEDCAGLGSLHESCKLLGWHVFCNLLVYGDGACNLKMMVLKIILGTKMMVLYKITHSTTKVGRPQIKSLLCERKQ